MIFYFSGTGNSKWVSEEIAKGLNDGITNIMDMKTSDGWKTYKGKPGETIGLVFPVYAWGPPEVVLKFAKDIHCDGGYTFAVCTCQSEAGNTMKILSKTFPLKGAWSISMPSNYVPSDMDSEEQIKDKIEGAEKKLPEIISAIQGKKQVTDVTKGSGATFKSMFAYRAFNKMARGTAVFTTDKDCNGCGTCAEVCPMEMIGLIEGKPEWKYANCLQCMACINSCPNTAILYAGDKSKTVGRYTFDRDGKKYL